MQKNIVIPEDIRLFTLPVKKYFFKKEVQDFYKLKYPGHPRGCPNYGVRDHCPPKIGLINKYLDITKPLYLVWEEFDLAEHIYKMQMLHPHWSERQARCVLYWQQGVRKRLLPKVQLAMECLGTTAYTTIPEGMGVQMYRTCYASGLKLERISTLKTHRQIAILGMKILKRNQLNVLQP